MPPIGPEGSIGGTFPKKKNYFFRILMIKHDLTAPLSEASVKKCSSKPLFLTPRRQTKITSAAPGYGKFAITLKAPQFVLNKL